MTTANPTSDVQPRRRSRAALLVGALAIVALAAVSAWYTLLRPSGERAETAPQPTESASVPTEQPQSLPPPPVSQAPQTDRVPDTGMTQEQSREMQRRAADDARTRMQRAKSAARQSGSAATGSASYAAATAAEREANRLYQSRQLPEATAKFYEASGLFRSAELTPPPVASDRSQSTPASPRPQPEPTTTAQAPASPPPAAPQTAPPTMPAAENPVQLPPSTAPRVPPPPAAAPRQAEAPITAAEGTASPAAENGVRELLRRYEQALESRSLDAMRRVWPGLSGSQEDALRREFQQSRRIDVDVDDPHITLSGATGTVTFVRRYHLTTSDGQRLDRNSRTTMSVRRAGSDWVIDRVHFEAIR